MSSKVLGYSLIIVGLVIISLALLSVFNIFSKKSQPVEIFTLTGVNLDLASAMGGSMPSVGNGGVELVTSDKINKPLNLVAHLMFMGFFSTIGYKIAGVGTMLTRPIKVNLKGESMATKGV